VESRARALAVLANTNLFLAIAAQGLLMKVINVTLQRKGSYIAEFSVLMANTVLTRARGLLFRAPMTDDRAMLISPCNSVHTWFMGYKLDVVFLNREKKIMHIAENIKPWRFAYHFKASAVIEFNAGVVAKYGMTVGDVFSEC